MNKPILAIDFGTSNSLVGAWINGQRIAAMPIDPKSSDPTLMRTLLYFLNEDQCYYGADAINQYISAEMEGRLFRSFKSHLPNRNYLGTFMNNRVLPLETQVGIFLLEIKRRAEKHLNQKCDAAVIGRPARYSMDDVQDKFAIHRMTKAAEFAGFKQVQFVPEPLAAALDFRKSLKEEKLVLVGDFGGGTSDFTLIRISDSTFKEQDVLSIEGCPLAGDALDSLFMSHRLSRFFGAEATYRMPLGSNRMKMPPSISERLNKPAHLTHLRDRDTYEFIKEIRKCALTDDDRINIDRLFIMIEDQQIFSFFEEIESTKRKLSNTTTADFNFDYPGLEIQSHFLRTEFEQWATPVHSSIFAALDECMKQATVNFEDIDLVCLTGGSARVPMIRQEFERRFGAEKLQTQSHFHSVLSGLIEACEHFKPIELS